MKYKIVRAGLVLMMCMAPLPVYAAETATTQMELPEDFVPDDERFESEQDRQKKILESQETVEETEPETDKWGGYASYQEYLESTKVEGLSEEQIEEGYSVNEYGQPVSPDEKENGEGYTEIIMGGVNPGNNTGYVTIKLSTEAEVHEEIYVHLINLNNFRMYGCNLYEINGYETTICLPAGSYQVQEVAPTLDGAGRFFTYNRQFKVDATQTQILEVAMIDKEAVVEATEQQETETPVQEETNIEPVETEQVPQPVNTGSSESQEEEKNNISPLAIFVAVLIIGGAFLALKKLFPEAKKHEFKGFDE